MERPAYYSDYEPAYAGVELRPGGQRLSSPHSFGERPSRGPTTSPDGHLPRARSAHHSPIAHHPPTPHHHLPYHQQPQHGGVRGSADTSPYGDPLYAPAAASGGYDGAQTPTADYHQHVSTSRSGRVTATLKAQPIPVGEGLHLNPGYFKTCPGLLKILQIILGMVCLGCSTPALTGCARLFLFVTAVCYILTVLLCVIIVLGVDRALHQIPWLTGELVYTAIAAVCFALVSLILLADIASYDWPGRDYRAIRDQYIAAGVFGLAQACAYAFGLFRLFIDWKAKRPVPAPRTVTTN